MLSSKYSDLLLSSVQLPSTSDIMVDSLSLFPELEHNSLFSEEPIIDNSDTNDEFSSGNSETGAEITLESNMLLPKFKLESGKTAILKVIPASPSSHFQIKQQGKAGELSKNALAARENRRKKKRHLEDLENSVSRLEVENKTLKLQVDNDREEIAELRKENVYLRSVLANTTEISALLKNVKRTPGVKFGSSIHDDKVKPFKNNNAGVCLHVCNKKVSVEFCSTCNANAQQW